MPDLELMSPQNMWMHILEGSSAIFSFLLQKPDHAAYLSQL